MIAIQPLSNLLVVATLLCHAAATAIKRDPTYSQIRFVGCMNNKARGITYNDWSPKPDQMPDDWLLLHAEHSTFLGGSQLEGTSLLREIPWKVQTQGHDWNDDMFKTFLGTATYGTEGFNCFQDDSHYVFSNFLVGNCFTEIYCTHQDARNLTITAATELVELATNITAESVLSRASERVDKQSMNTDPVKLDATILFEPDTECAISFDGKGTNEDLKALVKVLSETIAKDSSLFRYQVDKHNGACACLNPNACVCRDPTFTGRLTLPRKFTLVTTNNPPPFSNNNPSTGAWLEATIACSPPVEDESLCTAMQLAFGLGALVPGVNAAFGTLLWSASVACAI